MTSVREEINTYAAAVASAVSSVDAFKFKHMRGAMGGYLSAISVALCFADYSKIPGATQEKVINTILSNSVRSAFSAQKRLLLDMQKRKSNATAGDARLKGVVYTDNPHEITDFFAGRYCSLAPYSSGAPCFAKLVLTGDTPLYKQAGYEVMPDNLVLFGVYNPEEEVVHVFGNPISFTVDLNSAVLASVELFDVVVRQDEDQ